MGAKERESVLAAGNVRDAARAKILQFRREIAEGQHRGPFTVWRTEPYPPPTRGIRWRQLHAWLSEEAAGRLRSLYGDTLFDHEVGKVDFVVTQTASWEDARKPLGRVSPEHRLALKRMLVPR